MKAISILSILVLFVLIVSCKDKVSVFYRQTDVAKDGLKGKVRSVAQYHCTLDSAAEYCSGSRREYNERGFLIEKSDTLQGDAISKKFFYNSDGLLVKQVFKAVSLSPVEQPYYIAPWEETYEYSFPERKRTTIFRENKEGNVAVDTIVTFYDKNGNEIQYSSKTVKSFKEYDKHGFLVLERYISKSHPEDTSDIRYVNDAEGRPVKITWSDGTFQTRVYDKDGNVIEGATFNKSGKKESGCLIGHCGFDKNGNYLKSISMCPQNRTMTVDSQIIEYY